jgi:hypothetical protein
MQALTMKPDSSIKNITLAAVRRHAVDLHEWKYTIIEPAWLPADFTLNHNELPLVFCHFDLENWTVISSQRVVGKIGNQIRQLAFTDLDDVMYGNPKNKTTPGAVRITDYRGNNYDFLMDTGKPSIAFIYAINTALALHRSAQ